MRLSWVTKSSSAGAWECHDKMTSSNSMGLNDHDLEYVGAEITDCKGRCDGKNCKVIVWHSSVQHCHTLSGAVTHDDFVASLTTSSDYSACFFNPSGDAPSPPPSEVLVGLSASALTTKFTGTSSSYMCTESKCGGPYDSGLIHTAHLTPLEGSKTYYYRVAGGDVQSFVTPPPAEMQSVPVRLGLIGDLGQTDDSNRTIHHLLEADVAMVLHAGDLSYADCFQPRWDTYGLLCDPLASKLAWMTCAGNHEIEDPGKCGASLKRTFAAYDARYGSLMPVTESGSNSTQYFSFETAGVHVIMLGSYINDVPTADAMAKQLAWLKADLASIDRAQTPWLVGALHAPWYNSNTAHQMEKEERDMRDAMEQALYDARMDVMFAGHVHAYERSYRTFQSKADDCAPYFVNIGDGGNREGLASRYLSQPAWSAYREAAFGHGILSVENRTHAHWTWHRDEDNERVVSDEVWLVKNPGCFKDPSTYRPAEHVEAA